MFISQRVLSLVIVGKFNPSIIHPSWFELKKIARNIEVESARIDVVHNQVAAFEMAGINVRAQNVQLLLSSADESMWETIRDWGINIFTYLSETPVSALGINLDLEIDIGNREKWDKFGDILVPKTAWKNVLISPKLRNVRIQSDNPDDDCGYIWTQVEPATNPQLPFGVQVQINNHFDLKKGGNFVGTAGIVSCLQEKWESSISRSDAYVKSLMGLI
ncbi:MAG: hypothetical protein ACOH5I_16655 [Oligoflexus sp.]